MSRSHYSLDKEHAFTIRGTAKLLNVASAKYGGDWHSVPHTHNHMELFYIVGGKGQFLIQDQLYPVDANTLVIIKILVCYSCRPIITYGQITMVYSILTFAFIT